MEFEVYKYDYSKKFYKYDGFEPDVLKYLGFRSTLKKAITLANKHRPNVAVFENDIRVYDTEFEVDNDSVYSF